MQARGISPAVDGVRGVSSSSEGTIPPRIRPRSHLHSAHEVYGFVLWLGTFLLAPMLLIWAFCDPSTLRAMGMAFMPDRYWLLATPAYLIVALLFVPIMYASWNMMHTLPPEDINTVRDGFTRRQLIEAREGTQGGASEQQHEEEAEDPSDPYSIDDIVDIPIERVNQLLYARR
jgi:hypothetical protein